ncbi:MAG: MFS transporter [Gammaproteobacteria bacterium]|nr:MAG: MFS transporter [Gammaproteobacteria bacterium]
MSVKIRFSLLLMTTMAVIGDALLMPFYPQFFSQRFGVLDPKSAGIYLAAICFTVMWAFPIWAYLAKTIPTLFIMFITQALAGLLALSCFWVKSWELFWILSLAMFTFKAGYLLIYPLLMQLEPEENHARVIGFVSIIIHFGAILGALLGGSVLQIADVSKIYWIMAASDFIAMFFCVYLWKNFGLHLQTSDSVTNPKLEVDQKNREPASSWRTYRLGLVMLFFYFGANVTCPFFVTFWQSISKHQSTFWSGVIYSIPGIMALCVLWVTHKKNIAIPTMFTLGSVLVLSVVGYSLQNVSTETSVIIGRILFGIGIYYASIYLELLIFHGGNKDAYATDVSRVYFFQSMGVVFSSYCAGVLVDHANVQMTFYVGSFFLILTGVTFWFMKSHLLSGKTTSASEINLSSVITSQSITEFKGAKHDF